MQAHWKTVESPGHDTSGAPVPPARLQLTYLQDADSQWEFLGKPKDTRGDVNEAPEELEIIGSYTYRTH